MTSAILPVVRSLILCDAVSAGPAGKVHLAGAFNAIRPRAFPHADTRVVVFGQLTGGVDGVPTVVEVRHVVRDEVVYGSGPLLLRFPDRITVVQLALTLARCTFPYPGLYAVELFCHNQFVCDTTVRLFEPEGDDEPGTP